MKPYKTSPAALAHKKVKKESVSTWKKKAWVVFSKWVRERDNWTCYTCGKYGGVGTAYMHAGHFISRSANATLFSEDNVRAQCYYCNIRARGNVKEFSYRLKNELGEKRFLALIELGHTTKQFTVQELKQLVETYKPKL